jgi:hypothetical protein
METESGKTEKRKTENRKVKEHGKEVIKKRKYKLGI